MRKYLGMSLSIGLIAGAWFFVASSFGLQPWPAYIGWSVFFWEGANWRAVKRGFPAIVLGAVLGYLTFMSIGALGEISSTGKLALASFMVCVLAFLMTIAQTFEIFAVASATFIGASHYFALRGYIHDPREAFLTAAFVTSAGLILGIFSMAFGALFNRFILKDDAKG